MTSTFPIKLVRTSNLVGRLDAKHHFRDVWYHSHETLQYCDGLRGPLIVYDPYDPYADWYDVDDGQCFYCFSLPSADLGLRTESTIITLNDWYHVPTLQVAHPSYVLLILV